MKAVILAGGLGSRIVEESAMRPKPMIEIGGRPLLWHIMHIYSAHGVQEFIVCCGYKGYLIKEYFANYFLHRSDVTIDLQNNLLQIHQNQAEPWKITLVDTGLDTMTGGRLKRVSQYLDDETFCLTYGDGLSDVDITALVACHRQAGRLATITAVQPPGRFGALSIEGERVMSFAEKLQGDGGWINGGFFVLEPAVLDYIHGDDCIWEAEPLTQLAAASELAVYKHHGFWQAMDTLRDKNQLEALWNSGRAAWMPSA